MKRPAAAFVAEATGLDAETLGAGALDAAVRAHGADRGRGEAELVERLRQDPVEASAFLARLLVHETWLFRDRVPFEMLGTFALLRARAGRLPLRVLSFPCATGEEPWSIAATLLDAGLAPRDFHVVACDLEPRALAAAERGVYPRRAFRGNESVRAARFFRAAPGHEDEQVAAPAEARPSVEFRRANLFEAQALAGDGPFDAIFCRNALVYMTPEARRQVIGDLRGLLAPDGILVAGHSEVPTFLALGFHPFGPPGAFAVAPAEVSKATRVAPRPFPAPLPTPPAAAAAAARTSRHDASRNAAPTPSARAEPVPSRRDAAASLDEARALADTGRVTEAERLVRGFLDRHPDEAQGHLLLGVLLVATRRHAEARAVLERAIYLDPGCEDALLHLAALAESAGDRPAADRLRARAARLESPS
ncbi:MAG: CheR family methyltransferase [Alphaproteobacteria bacterium]